jgi:hypothetical protein
MALFSEDGVCRPDCHLDGGRQLSDVKPWEKIYAVFNGRAPGIYDNW